MACHGSEEGAEEPCRGYLAIEGHGNLNVRVLAATGQIPLGDVLDACEELDLYDSFAEMLAAHEAAKR